MYRPGDYYVICDVCQLKAYRSECKKTYDGKIAHVDGCWYPEHPQEKVRAIPDDQRVPEARPRKTDKFISDLAAAIDPDDYSGFGGH